MKARSLIEHWIEVVRTGNIVLYLPSAVAASAWVLAQLGEASEPQPGPAAHAQHLLGDIAAHPDRFDPGSGEAHYRQTLALAAPRGMRPLVAHCHLGLGRLYRRMGKTDPAREHLTSATTMYREMDMRVWPTQAEVAMAGLG